MATERRFSGTLTSEYDLFDLACPKGPILDATMAREIRRFKPRRQTQVLDALELGFGTGFTSKVILGCRADLRLTAMDNEPQMLPKARKNLKQWIGDGRLTLHVTDALAFLRKQPTRRYDVVATAATLHNFAVPYRALVWKELSRIMKPGALFINADKYAQKGPAQRSAVKARMGRYFGVAVPRQSFDWLKSVVLHYMDDESPERRMDEAEQAALMRSAGFVGVRRIYRMDMTAVVVAYRA
ncbi:MAG: class I SAM-dependent methyltransferase [Elusimicrobiota bacterium]|nr:MAG: class I SAM-dependent methyltransferase [Elusimicrobiota bacterium]